MADSFISIEKMKAPILIFFTKSDTVWPSAQSGKKLFNRLKKNNYGYSYKHICFNHMYRMTLEKSGSLIKGLFKSEKQFLEEFLLSEKQWGMKLSI